MLIDLNVRLAILQNDSTDPQKQSPGRRLDFSCLYEMECIMIRALVYPPYAPQLHASFLRLGSQKTK